MKTNQIVYMFLLSLLLIGCSGKEKEESNYVVVNLEKSLTQGKRLLSMNQLVEDVNIIPVETNDSTLLKHLFIVKNIQNDILAYDYSKLYRINKRNGKIATVLDKIGNGPGEYIHMTQVVPSGEFFFIYDAMQKKILKYNADGSFLESFRNDSIGLFKILEDGNIAACYSPFVRPDFSVAIYDNNWHLINEVVKNENKDIETDMLLFNSITQSNNKAFFRPIGGDTLYNITSKDAIPYLVFSEGKYKAPMRIIANSLEEEKHGYHYIMNKNVKITSNYLFLSYHYKKNIYHDIWSIKNHELLYRNINPLPGDKDGIALEINGKEFIVWPSYIQDDIIYIVLESADAIRLIPSLPEDTNPIIVSLQLKR